MKPLITALLLIVTVTVSGQQAQAPQQKPPAEAQAKFQQARKRLEAANIAAELARRELDAATEHANSVINEIRADNGWPAAKFDVALDPKSGELVFQPKPAGSRPTPIP